MNPLLHKIEEYITINKLFTRDEKIIVAVSGGADSIFLLHALISLEYSCMAAHCNFHLRGAESDRDEKFVQTYCAQHNIHLYKTDFDTETYANTHNLSIEMAARELRYNWFENIRIQAKANCIAVAHHKDDQAETVLLNLIRGTGLKGLTGMKCKTKNHIVRPLLSISRNQIIDFLQSNAIDFVEDSSNKQNIYRRNKIRLDVLPLLATINPSVTDAITQASEHLHQVEKIYIDYIENSKSAILVHDAISIPALLATLAPEALLYEILKNFNFNATVCGEIFASLNSISGKRFFSYSHELIKDRATLQIRKLEQEAPNKIFSISSNETHLTEPLILKIKKTNASNFEIQKQANKLSIDADKISYPLILRKWLTGDYFYPLGMKGKKKLSDYFSDHKFSRFDKENTWLLCNSDGKIIWIIGHRLDDRFKVSNNTSHLLEITYEPK